MHEIMVTREIPTSKERIWKVLDDFGAISTYHPQVERSPITNGVTSGKGARRTCYFQGGGSCDEEITAYRPGTGYTFAVSNFVSFPVARAVADFDISQVAHGTSRVTFRMRFIPKFGPMGWVMAKLMMKAQFRKIMGQILKGLEDQVLAGQVVQPDGSLASNAA